MTNKLENSPHDGPIRQRFFGRRKGPALSDRKQTLVNTLLPDLEITAPKPGGNADVMPIDLTHAFKGEKKEYWLEIGFGKGEHLAKQALNNPDVGLIGCEPYMNGVAGLLSQIDAHQITNIRIYSDDARHVLEGLPAASISKIFLIHPDPWPKKRHARRRFVNPENLTMFSRILKDGGEFRAGTDHPIYREWTAIQMTARDDFEWLAESKQDWSEKPDDWTETRYETKALEGKATYFIYRHRK